MHERLATKREIREAGLDENIDPLNVENLIMSDSSFTEDEMGAIFLEKVDNNHLPHERNKVETLSKTQEASMAYVYGSNLEKPTENRFEKPKNPENLK